MSKIFYVNAPDTNGVFTASNTTVSEEFKKGVSFFRFVQKDEGTAEFGLSKKASAVSWGLKNREILGTVCVAENPGFDDAKSIVVLESGKAELQPNGDWKVIKKSKIKYASEEAAEAQAPAVAPVAPIAPAAPVFCSSCGTQALENSKFCQKCGKAVGDNGAALASEAPQEEYEELSLWGYYVKCLKNYATFSGRARRKEYWGFFLFDFLIAFGIGILGLLFGDDDGILQNLYCLATLIPAWAVFCRRMHDIGKSGWNWLWGFAIIVGWIYLFILCCREGDAEENQYGPSTKWWPGITT